MGILDDAAAHLRTWHGLFLAEDAHYHQDGTLYPIRASQGSTVIETQSSSGALIQSESVDFIVESDPDLVGTEIEVDAEGTITNLRPQLRLTPRVGDKILFREKWYRVTDLGTGRCYRPHSRDGKSLRIHTKAEDLRDC